VRLPGLGYDCVHVFGHGEGFYAIGVQIPEDRSRARSKALRAMPYLTQSRKEIDRKYDYRYCVLTEVFWKLVREGRHWEPIRSDAKFLASLDAVA
jgi:hypothetical protein